MNEIIQLYTVVNVLLSKILWMRQIWKGKQFCWRQCDVSTVQLLSQQHTLNMGRHLGLALSCTVFSAWQSYHSVVLHHRAHIMFCSFLSALVATSFLNMRRIQSHIPDPIGYPSAVCPCCMSLLCFEACRVTRRSYKLSCLLNFNQSCRAMIERLCHKSSKPSMAPWYGNATSSTSTFLHCVWPAHVGWFSSDTTNQSHLITITLFNLA